MEANKLKILLLGDYSNCHRTLATGLRKLGCDVTVASDGTSWMHTERDVDITRRPGKIGGLLHYICMDRLLNNRLSGFDIVSVNDPNFTSLKPKRLKSLFNILKKHNGSVFYTAMSTDLAYLDMVSAKDSPLRYSEWFVDGEPSRMFLSNPSEWELWHGKALADYQQYFFDQIDGAVSVLYEYQLGIERRLGKHKTTYGGIPIDTGLFQPVILPENIDKVRFFLGRDRNRKLMKGSDILEDAAKKAIAAYPDKAELTIVENVPFNEFIRLLKNAHVVLDQIYSYTPATTALMAMACGLNVVSGAEPEYYDFINENGNRPIINAPTDPEELTSILENIIVNRDRIAERGRQSRKFVVKHNDSTTVAHRYLDFWISRLNEK